VSAPILALSNLSKVFTIGADQIRAVDKVTLKVERGECLAIVGESGSGKTTIASMILGIYGASSGEMEFNGAPLAKKRTLALRRAIQLVQQNPLSSLNPKRSVGASIRLALDVHHIGTKAGRLDKVGELLKEVGLPAGFQKRSPGALSGGQCQRVAIARALACESELLVLDEPTSSLDVLVQARVLNLLNDLRARRRLSYIFITHDLSVVRNIADRVAVFKKGKLVEINITDKIFSAPSHLYTRNLIAAVPAITPGEIELRNRLAGGEGQ